MKSVATMALQDLERLNNGQPAQPPAPSSEVPNAGKVSQEMSGTKLAKYHALCMTYLPAFFASNWNWFSFKYPCEETQSVLMMSYAKLLLNNKVTKTQFFEAMDQALLRPITKHNKENWPSPIEFLELCLPTAEELGLPSYEEMLKVFQRFAAHKRSGSSKPFVFNCDFEEHIHFVCCARYRDVKEADWLKYVRSNYDYWVGQYQQGNRPLLQKKLVILPESKPRIDVYIDKVGLPKLGRDRLSQRIRELGLAIKSKTIVG